MSASQQNGTQTPVRARTLEYRQAMKDFHIMFPTIEKDVIECVLRSNCGHVDSTIDQLLQLTQDGSSKRKGRINRLYHTYEGTSESSESNSPELREMTSSSEEDQPPLYTPTSSQPPPPPPAFSFSSEPEPFSGEKRFEYKNHRTFRDWNPPLLGALPDDFLRISVKQSPKPRSSQRSKHSERSRRSNSNSVRSNHRSEHNSPLPSSRERPLQRRRTTGQVNIQLNSTPDFDRLPQNRMVMVETNQSRNSRHHSSRSANSSSGSYNSNRGRRSQSEQDQYMEDRKVALLLQNEEFLKELKRNEDFLTELNKGTTTESGGQSSSHVSRENYPSISVDPLNNIKPANNTLEQLSSRQSKFNTSSNHSGSDDSAFKESIKHMNKAARKRFNEIAKKFPMRSRKSYKNMNPVDPIFATCYDDHDIR